MKKLILLLIALELSGLNVFALESGTSMEAGKEPLDVTQDVKPSFTKEKAALRDAYKEKLDQLGTSREDSVKRKQLMREYNKKLRETRRNFGLERGAERQQIEVYHAPKTTVKKSRQVRFANRVCRWRYYRCR